MTRNSKSGLINDAQLKNLIKRIRIEDVRTKHLMFPYNLYNQSIPTFPNFQANMDRVIAK